MDFQSGLQKKNIEHFQWTSPPLKSTAFQSEDTEDSHHPPSYPHGFNQCLSSQTENKKWDDPLMIIIPIK